MAAAVAGLAERLAAAHLTFSVDHDRRSPQVHERVEQLWPDAGHADGGISPVGRV